MSLGCVPKQSWIGNISMLFLRLLIMLIRWEASKECIILGIIALICLLLSTLSDDHSLSTAVVLLPLKLMEIFFSRR